MKILKKLLIVTFSLLFLLGISSNFSLEVLANENENSEDINYVNQKITFVDENGNPVEMDDSITFARLEKQGDTEVPVPVYLVDGKDNRSDEAYNYGEELTLDIEDGSIYTDSLIEGETYLLFFGGNYVFKKATINEEEQTESIEYYMYGSFIAGQDEELKISYNTSIEAIYDENGNQRISDEKLAEIAQTGAIMQIVSTTYYRGGCTAYASQSFSVYVTNGLTCNDHTTYNLAGYITGTGSLSFTPTYCSGAVNEAKYKIVNSSGKTVKSGTASAGDTVTLQCNDIEPQICTPAASQTCSNGITVKQYYSANGGSYCDKEYDTRTRSNGSRTCNSNGTAWSSCGYGTWSGSVTGTTCYKSNGSETGYINFNTNVNSDSASKSVSGLDRRSISRDIYYTQDGWDNYSTTFTSDTTAYAKYKESGRGTWSSTTLPTPSRTGYTFINYTKDGQTYNPGYSTNEAGATFTANWKANVYKLTVKNTNDRVSITTNIQGEEITLAPGESKIVDVTFDTYYSVEILSTSLDYYTPYIKSAYSTGSIDTANKKTLSDNDTKVVKQMSLQETVELDVKRNTETFTLHLYNDNGYTLTNGYTIAVYDNVDGELIDTIASEATGSLNGNLNKIESSLSINANKSSTLTFSLPVNTFIKVSATNNANTTGYDNSTTGKTIDYQTLVETDTMYNAKDSERTSYGDELGQDYVVFYAKSDALEPYKQDTYNSLTIDNQYLKTNYAFTSENTVTVKLYECLTDACTTSWTVQATEHDANYNYYAKSVSNEVENESVYLASLTGTSGTFETVDRYKKYKIVQESLIKDRYYSWDSGYEITTNDYDGYNTGVSTLDLNKEAKAYKIDVYGKKHDAVFSGSTVNTGKGGSLVTSALKQPYTEVAIKATTGSGVPVAGVEMYFGAATDSRTANQNIYVAAPTTKQGITFKSGGSSGKALQPDIDYSGYLGGSWVTDLSGDYAPYNGYLADDSWYDNTELPMSHYQEEDESATEFDLVIDTVPLTLKAKTDIGNLNAVFNVQIGNTTYNYGTDGANGEMIKSKSTIVMHLGSDEYNACDVDTPVGEVCLDDNGYYNYTIDVPVDKLITVKNANTGLYYDVKQTCDVDTDKYACRSFVSESTDDAHTEVFDFTRQTATLNVESILDNVQIDRNVINTVTLKVKDIQNATAPCDANKMSYCEAWGGNDDLTSWEGVKLVKQKDGTYAYTFEMNPKTNATATETLSLPAGLDYEVTAKVKVEQTNNWLANFINGIYGLTNSDKYNSGYHTYATNGSGVLAKGENNVVLNTNDYQYARINITSNAGATFAIYDKDNNELSSVTFGEDGTKYVDVTGDASPYTIKQTTQAPGYYLTKDETIAVVNIDDTYSIDLSQETIDTVINVVTIHDDEELPITNIDFAIGEDADHIIYTGTIEEINELISSEAGLATGTTYNVYVGGKVLEGKVTDYYGVSSLEVPLNAPDEDLQVKVYVNNTSVIPNEYQGGELVKRTVETNDLEGTRILTTHVKITLSEKWTYGDYTEGVYEFDLEDGESIDTYLPTLAIDTATGMTYTVEVSDAFGYTTRVTDDSEYAIKDAEDHIIHIENTPLDFELEISGSNTKYSDVKLKDVKYTIYNYDNCDENKKCEVIDEITTDENGVAKTTLTYGLNFVVKQTSIPSGYKLDTKEYVINVEEKYPTFKFGEDTYKLVINNEPYSLTVNVSSKDKRTGNGINGTYHLYDKTAGKDVDSRTDNGSLSVEYGNGHSYILKVDAPYGYKSVEDKELTIEFNTDGSIKSKDYTFEFEPKNLAVNVNNTIKGDVLTLIDGSGNTVKTITAEGKTTVVDGMVYGEKYTIKVTHPKGYYQDNTVYEVKLPDGAEFKDDLAWCEDIDLKKVSLIDNNTLYGVKIKVVDSDGEPVKDVTVGLYNKDKLITDIYKDNASSTTNSEGIATLYIYKGVNSGTVKIISVPENYKMPDGSKNFVAKYFAKSADKLEGYTEIELVVEYTEDYKEIIDKVNSIIDENNKNCEAARTKLETLIASYNESDYSTATWEKIQQIFKEARKKLESSNACNLSKDSLIDSVENGDDITIFDYDSFLAEIEAQLTDLMPKGTHWFHWVIIIVSLIAIIANIVVKKTNINVLITAIVVIFNAIGTIFIDFCIYSIIAFILHLVIQLIIMLIRWLKKDDDNSGDPNNESPETNTVNEDTEVKETTENVNKETINEEVSKKPSFKEKLALRKAEKAKQKVIDDELKPLELPSTEPVVKEKPIKKKKQKPSKKQESEVQENNEYSYDNNEVKNFISQSQKEADDFLSKYQD